VALFDLEFRGERVGNPFDVFGARGGKDAGVLADHAHQLDQAAQPAWNGRYVGELVAAAGGAVTLPETPTNVLCVCADDDGDFVTNEEATLILTDFATANTFDLADQPDADAGDGLSIGAHQVPYSSGEIVVDAAHNGTNVRVHYAPADLHTAELAAAVPQVDDIRGGRYDAAREAYQLYESL
jgi:hypothetical protein